MIRNSIKRLQTPSRQLASIVDSNQIMKTTCCSSKQKQQREAEFLQLVGKYIEQLEVLYKSNETETELRKGKAILFKLTDNEYGRIRASWGKHGNYDSCFNDGINNAKLAIILACRDLVSDFMELFANKNLAKFYRKAPCLLSVMLKPGGNFLFKVWLVSIAD